MFKKQLGGLSGLQITGITSGILLIIGIIIIVVIFTTSNNTNTTSTTSERTCNVKTDCAAGFLCSRDKECVPGCESNTDCPTDERCVESNCVTKENKQSISLKDTKWEDVDWTPSKGSYDSPEDEYIPRLRANIGDKVEMKFKLKESATDLCAPAANNVVALGEVKIKNDDRVGVEWTHLKNDSHSSDYQPWNCCWFRGDDPDWNMKYLGNARNNPTYDSGLKSIFTLNEAGKMLKKTILDVRECPVNPWEPCPNDYVPYGETGNQFCCKGTVSPTGSSCQGQACAQNTKKHQGAPWCSTSKSWYPDACPIGLNTSGSSDSQFCCSGSREAISAYNGKCPPAEFSCANKTSDIQGRPWCETTLDYRPVTMMLKGNSGKYCTDTTEGIICDSSEKDATTFEIREYPEFNSGVYPFVMKNIKTNKWCIGGTENIVCNSPAPTYKHVFDRTINDDATYNIKPANSRLWCSDEQGRNLMRCNRNEHGPSEKFTLFIATGSPKGGLPLNNPVVNKSK